MLSKIRKSLGSDEGFTLIELMVVILIIGILVAIAVPSFIAVRNRGYQAQAKSNLRNAVTAISTYGTDEEGDYSAVTAAILESDYEGNLDFIDGLQGAVVNAVYIESAGNDAFGLSIISQDGQTYTATKAAGAGIVYNF